MPESNEAKRIQVPMSKELRDLLRDLTARLSKEWDDDIGVGTTAAQMLEVLRNHPDLLARVMKLIENPKARTTRQGREQVARE